MEFGEGETGVPQIAGPPGEAGVVAARRLGPALQDVPGDDSPREPVVRILLPPEAPGRGPGDQGGVGDAAGDDDVGAADRGRR